MRAQLDLLDGTPVSVLREAPYQPTSATSREAAALIRPRCRPQRERVYEHLVACGSRGATMHEVAAALNIPLSSICARMSELRESVAVIETDQRRETPWGKMASVWRAR